jgi:hypothetical protein
MSYRETNPRVLAVLSGALTSSSRATRLRAVAMLARVECAERLIWLEAALEDPDEDVRYAARAVTAWILEVNPVPWPHREDPHFDRTPQALSNVEEELEASALLRWEWEYSVEIWRGDGLLLGVYLAMTCEEDDEHAKCIALGQAILASADPFGDAFEPELTAAFITEKRRVRRQVRGDRRRGDTGR